MPDNDTSLPPGFVVQGTAPSSEPSTGGSPPPGFVLDNQSASSSGSSEPTPPDGFVLQNSPENGQPAAPTTHVYQDSSQPFYKRAYDWANTPLTESLFGLPSERQGAGGFERAGEHIVAGLTSPLSILLTAATFGTGGILESAGATALKEAGLSAEEIANAVKGSEAAVGAVKDLKPIEPAIQNALRANGHDLDLVNRAKAELGPVNLETEFGQPEVQKALAEKGFTPEQLKDLSKASDTISDAKSEFKPVEDAVRASGADVDKWRVAQETLYKSGLTEHDLLGGNFLERGAFQVLRNTVPEMSVAAAARAAKTANTVLNAGFTLQQFESAAALSPRFLDALKEGDYDHAIEYGTEALAGGALGLAGASHAFASAGELFSPVLGEKLRPSDEALAMKRANGEREAQHAVAEQEAISLDQRAREILGHKPGGNEAAKAEKQQELANVFHQVVTGGNTDRAAQWYNALAEAAGKDDRLPTGQTKVGPYTISTDKSSLPLTGSAFDVKISNEEGRQVGRVFATAEPGGFYRTTSSLDDTYQNKGLGTAAYEQVIKNVLGAGKTVVSDWDRSPQAEAVWNKLKAKYNVEEQEPPSYMRAEGAKKTDKVFVIKPNEGRPVNGLPADLSQQIASSSFPKLPEKYQDTVLTSLKKVATGQLSDKEISAAKLLTDEQAKNFEIGSANDLLHHQIEDYMTRAYKDQNPEGKVILSNAKQGRFATNVSMARQRVYDSHLTALLKSPKEMELDPVKLTAQGREQIIKAASNKQLIDNLRDKFTRASDGRPAVVLSGSGQVIQGPNGEDPTTFIQPNRVRKLNIADGVVKTLTDSGQLERYLEDGTIKDITPRVYSNSIGAAIDRLSQEVAQDPKDTLTAQRLQTLKDIQEGKRPAGDLSAYNDSLDRKYAWDPQDYVTLNNGAMRGWNFVTNDTGGRPVFVRSDIRVHPEFAEYLKNRLGLEPSALQKNPVSKALLSTGTKLKETLLSLSPFHMVQEALRGLMVGINPFHITGPDILTGERVDPSDPNSPTIIKKAVEHGFTTGTDYKSLQEHSEGLSAGGGLLRKIPGVGKTIANSMDFYQNLLFKRYIPALKSRSVELMFREYQRLHPDWSVDRVARAAAQHTNDTFGGVNWKAMGRSATTQDWGRLIALAPDWLEAEARSGARLFNKEEGGLGRAQMAKLSLGLWGIARVLNLVTTGNAHLEAPFGLATQNRDGKEIVYSIRTLPTDLLHAASDPVGFLKGRLSPTVSTGTELVTGRDRYGRKLQPEDLWADVFRNMAPIPLQSLGQVVSGTGPSVGNPGQLWKSSGGTATAYATPAQKMAADLASTHSEDGPVDPAQQARHRQVMEFEDAIRRGDMSWPDLMRLTYQTDQLREQELKKIQQNLTKTKDMTKDMASLYTRASRLPASDYLNLYDQMNASERAALAPLTLQVQKRYLTKAKKDETPEERAKDPVFQRLLAMVPRAPQQPQQ